MQEFICKVNGSEVDGQRLVVVPFNMAQDTNVRCSSDGSQDDTEIESGIGGGSSNMAFLVVNGCLI